jgi:hypothetical protein
MKTSSIFVGLAFALLLAGCLQQAPTQSGNNTPPGAVNASGSAKFQLCISQCGAGNAGNGTLCKDGCAVQEAADTKSTARCDSLIDMANRPSCYGTVAKAAGDITICNALTNATDKDYCVSVFGSQGASG